MKGEPDRHDRLCVSCKGQFTPWSMGADGEPVVEPPVAYRCVTCRSKSKTGV